MVKKILLASPFQQHSFRVAEALEKSGMLYKYATTVYDKPSSFLMKIIKKFLNQDNLERANKRRLCILDDDDVIQFCEWQGIIERGISRIDKTMLLINWWRGYFTKQFQKKVANYVIRHSNEISAVIAYDTFSEVLFDILQRKAPHIVKIIDHAHPSRYYLRDLYRTIDSGPFRITYEKECREYHTKPKVAEEYKDEIQKADYHLVASSFSKQAAIYTGVSETKIAVCPYGANKKSFKRNGNKDYFDTLKILFVGAVNQRKGIYQLLTAAKDLSNLGLEFNIVGTGRDFCKYLYKPYEKYVNFHGRVPFQKLLDLYDTNHIFVFPSLGEGYGMVIQEALSAGLPVITTPNCAGRDVITDGFNGFVVEAGSSNALKEKIIWFNEHRKELESMSINAEHSVKEMTWEQYGDNLVNILNNWLSE